MTTKKVLLDTDIGGDIDDALCLAYQAVDFMCKTIREQPHEISLLAIGHLTNIAMLFLMDPEIPKLIKELHIMSGVFSDELEASMDMPMANWNSWLDPHACAQKT